MSRQRMVSPINSNPSSPQLNAMIVKCSCAKDGNVIKEHLLQAFLILPWSLGEKIWWRLWRSEWQPLSSQLVTWPTAVVELTPPSLEILQPATERVAKPEPNLLPRALLGFSSGSPRALLLLPRDLSVFAAVPLHRPPTARSPN